MKLEIKEMYDAPLMIDVQKAWVVGFIGRKDSAKAIVLWQNGTFSNVDINDLAVKVEDKE